MFIFLSCLLLDQLCGYGMLELLVGLLFEELGYTMSFLIVSNRFYFGLLQAFGRLGMMVFASFVFGRAVVAVIVIIVAAKWPSATNSAQVSSRQP